VIVRFSRCSHDRSLTCACLTPSLSFLPPLVGVQEGDYARELDYFDRFSLVLGNGSILTASTTPHTRAIPLLPNPGAH
jgi:hypothetical protein